MYSASPAPVQVSGPPSTVRGWPAVGEWTGAAPATWSPTGCGGLLESVDHRGIDVDQARDAGIGDMGGFR